MAYNKFRTPDPDTRDQTPVLFDTDGTPLYETPYNVLLRTIIARNDVATLQRYIEGHGPHIFGPVEVSSWDPFYVAAERGSTDSLRALLEIYQSDLSEKQPIENWNFRLLNIACANAQFETAVFLLECGPPLGTLHDRDSRGQTPLLCAAGALSRTKAARKLASQDAAYAASVEDFIYMLLDRGASVPDANVYRTYGTQFHQQPRLAPPLNLCETVLGAAVPWASYEMVSRLIAEGADVHAQQAWYYQSARISADGGVTSLHVASGSYNLEGIRALLDHRGDIDISEMMSVADSDGRLPLHWALGCLWPDGESVLSDDESTSRRLSTVQLLLDAKIDSTNIPDKLGATSLHYVVESYASCSLSPMAHFMQLLELLLAKGADGSLPDSKGQTILHKLAFRSTGIESLDPGLLERFVGLVDINHTDVNGWNALHFMARNLRQVDAARYLVNQGANVNQINRNGNTPLHEAMGGRLLMHRNKDGVSQPPTLSSQIRAQDEIIAILQGAGASMDQPNAAGKTPRQLLEETRARWQRDEVARNRTW